MNHPYKSPLEQRIEAAQGGRSGMRFRSRPYDVQNLYVSLKQWRILHAVVDCGGYAEAAKALYLSQSTISYTIAKLQEQLGVPLLRIEGRKAVLTPEGRALLERSRNVLKEAIELEVLARQLGQGCAGEVRLVVEQNCPVDLLMRALHKFNSLGHASAIVRLREVAELKAEETLREQNADLAISESVPLGFLGEPLAEIEHIAVAHASHPLLALKREVTGADLARHVRIVVGQAVEEGRQGTAYLPTQHKWTMNSFDSAIAAVCEGLGFAWLPQHRIRKWLDDGSLLPLPLVDKHRKKSMLYLIHGRPWMASPIVGRLADVLRSFAAAETDGALQPVQQRSGRENAPA
jgi:DNA-binding transcriptional LysR family regulator